MLHHIDIANVHASYLRIFMRAIAVEKNINIYYAYRPLQL